MTRLEMLLTILTEECAETAQRATKCMRFGMAEIQPGQSLTNAQRLVYEFNDIVAIVQMLKEEGHIDRVIDETMVTLKQIKVEKYLEYSKQCGTLTN